MGIKNSYLPSLHVPLSQGSLLRWCAMQNPKPHVSVSQGQPTMVVCNAFGSNIFNVLIGLGLPYFVVQAARGELAEVCSCASSLLPYPDDIIHLSKFALCAGSPFVWFRPHMENPPWCAHELFASYVTAYSRRIVLM